MFLKRIEINGFKSFANKTEIILNNRITGIVGPNGSGKSNIADAIRWVLGEQSSKNLRGTKMEDVIFNGTQSRAKKPFCEVSLIFDNESGRIASEYSEIIITRRMFRNGESEYKLNNNSVRLKDIIDITRDTGIGKEGYSIIGQGKIDEILSSKPLQRRKVFEEAAGIMKYRARKEEAEKKLEKTDENLTRVEDILEELLMRLDPLKEQAEETRKYLALFDRQRILDANIFLLNKNRFSEKIEKLSKEISETEAELNRLTREFGEIIDESDKLNEELDNAIEQENTLNEQTSAINAEIERLNGEINLINERIANIEAEVLRTEDEISAFEESINDVEEQLSSVNDKITEIDEEIAICDEAIEALDGERSKLVSLSENHVQRISEAKTRQLDLMSQISSRNSELARLKAEKDGAEGRRLDLDLRLKKVIADKDQRKRIIEKSNERTSAMKAEKNDILSKINENNVIIGKEKDSVKKLEDEYSELSDKITDAKGRLKLMTDLRNEYDGYNDSVRNLMKALRERPELKRRLMGTVAEVINVPREYETAIETYLGASLQNIIVRDEYDAKALIELLRREKLGRVTFLPVEALKVTQFSKEDYTELKRHKGYIAAAHEVLEYSSDVAPAIEFLLSKTALTKDIDSSIEIMRAMDQAIKTVTLEGDINRPGGVMTGGSVNKKNFGLLSRERIMQEFKEKIAKLEDDAARKKGELDAQLQKISELKANAQADVEKLKDIEISLAEERERAASYISLLEGCEATERALNNQLTALDIEEKSLKEDTEKIASLINYLEDESQKIILVLQELESGSADNTKEISKLSEAVNDKKIRRAELSKEKQSFENECERLFADKSKNEQRIVAKRNSVATMASQSSTLMAELENTKERIESKKYELDESREASLEISERRRELRSLVVESQRATNEFQEQKTVLMERRLKLENQKEKVDIALENSEVKIWEDYELTYAAAELLKTDISYTAAVREVEDVRASIRALGSINPKAIEEYEEVSTRVNDMQTQRDDLIKAKDDLDKVINGLLSNMRDTFEDKFEQINVHFKSIFRELFGGGRAELYFEDGDILEAGIEIAAEPPGKKLQSLSLLSGGERALTAIALLFAMIRINPSPVCLLDEIDAPLDEANAVRFAEYLIKIVETQFMVITHRKPTMTACNALYGVTMEEKGVSRMVSVQIDKK